MPRIMGQLNHCTCICGMLLGKNIVACLLDEPTGKDTCEIIALAASEAYEDGGYRFELVSAVADYARGQGFRYMDVCISNADISAFLTLQKMGFRLIGVEADYYATGQQGLSVLNGIVNRDMLRYRADFNSGWVTWTREVKYK